MGRFRAFRPRRRGSTDEAPIGCPPDALAASSSRTPCRSVPAGTSSPDMSTSERFRVSAQTQRQTVPDLTAEVERRVAVVSVGGRRRRPDTRRRLGRPIAIAALLVLLALLAVLRRLLRQPAHLVADEVAGGELADSDAQ